MRLFPYRVQIYLFLLRQQNDNSIFRVAIELKKLIPHQYPTKHKAFAKAVSNLTSLYLHLSTQPPVTSWQVYIHEPHKPER